MHTMLEALTDETFVRRRTQLPANQWERAFPDQVRYALAIARHADKNNVAGLIKQKQLKTAHAELARHFSQLQQEYQSQRARANALLAAAQGKRPSRWRLIKRHRFNAAYGAMLDAYEAMEQFRRINTIHRLLFNANATRDAINQELVRRDAIRRNS
jgi:hypothetical protein